jgi:hypothetical protein
MDFLKLLLFLFFCWIYYYSSLDLVENAYYIHIVMTILFLYIVDYFVKHVVKKSN